MSDKISITLRTDLLPIAAGQSSAEVTLTELACHLQVEQLLYCQTLFIHPCKTQRTYNGVAKTLM